MKKACIALAVIFLLSSLLAVCLGAAVGAREIRDIMEGNSRFNDWFDELENWHDRWETHNGGKLLGETNTQFTIRPNEPVRLDFDFGDVRVLPSEDESAYMNIRYYGREAVADLSSLSYAEQVLEELHIGIRLPGDDSVTNLEADIYLPKARLAAMNAQLGVGDLTIEGMQFGKFTSSVKVGCTYFKNSSADSAELTTNTGELFWKDGSRASKSLAMHAGVGDIQLTWPATDGFRLSFEIGTGEFFNSFGEAVSGQTDTQLISSNGNLTFGDGSRAVSLSTTTGDITLRGE